MTTSSFRRLMDELLACAACVRRVDGSHSGGLVMSLPQEAILVLVEEGSGLTVPQMARRRGTSRQSVQLLVDRLVKAGFLRSAVNPDHRRSAHFQLTEAGRGALQQAQRRLALDRSRRLPGVTDAELDVCMTVLRGVRIGMGGRVPVDGRRPRVRGMRRPRPKRTQPVAQSAETSGSTFSPPEDLPVSLL